MSKNETTTPTAPTIELIEELDALKYENAVQRVQLIMNQIQAQQAALVQAQQTARVIEDEIKSKYKLTGVDSIDVASRVITRGPVEPPKPVTKRAPKKPPTIVVVKPE